MRLNLLSVNNFSAYLCVPLRTLRSGLFQRRGTQRNAEVFRVPKGYFDCQKTERSVALSLRGKLPAPDNSRDLFVEIWERESAPAELLLYISAFDGDLESESAAKISGG